MSKLDDILDEKGGIGFKYVKEEAKQQIKDLILELIDNTEIPDTSCAEFYREPGDSCEPEEHNRRSARWDAERELKEQLEESVKEL